MWCIFSEEKRETIEFVDRPLLDLDFLFLWIDGRQQRTVVIAIVVAIVVVGTAADVAVVLLGVTIGVAVGRGGIKTAVRVVPRFVTGSNTNTIILEEVMDYRTYAIAKLLLGYCKNLL